MRTLVSPQFSKRSVSPSAEAFVVRERMLQRKCACGGTPGPTGECDECKRKRLARKDLGNPSQREVPPIVDEVLQSSAQPLDPATRGFMEERFGYDFGNVRIHLGARAAESTTAINALAYTVGNHVVLGAGHDSPHTIAGKRVLAHELAHVVQQGGGRTLQAYRISNPHDPLEQEASRAEESIVSGKTVPPLSVVANSLQRQSGDPLEDPLGEKKKEAELDPKTKRAYAACPKLCKTFMPVEVAPDRFFALCDDTVKMSSPTVQLGGCTPGRLGTVVFVSGAPAWEMPKSCATCEVTVNGKPPPPTAPIKVGYIQTVEKVLSGGVYFKPDASGKWVWAGNNWLCASNARDGHDSSTAPWFGPDKNGNFAPEPFGTCPSLIDNPLVRLPSGQNIKKDKFGVDRPQWPLRRMRIDGLFHVWLVAQVGNASPIFIYNWSIECWVVALLNDDADPCNKTGWKSMDMKSVKSKGPGKGTATPVLTGATANSLKKPC